MKEWEEKGEIWGRMMDHQKRCSFNCSFFGRNDKGQSTVTCMREAEGSEEEDAPTSSTSSNNGPNDNASSGYPRPIPQL